MAELPFSIIINSNADTNLQAMLALAEATGGNNAALDLPNFTEEISEHIRDTQARFDERSQDISELVREINTVQLPSAAPEEESHYQNDFGRSFLNTATPQIPQVPVEFQPLETPEKSELDIQPPVVGMPQSSMFIENIEPVAVHQQEPIEIDVPQVDLKEYEWEDVDSKEEEKKEMEFSPLLQTETEPTEITPPQDRQDAYSYELQDKRIDESNFQVDMDSLRVPDRYDSDLDVEIPVQTQYGVDALQIQGPDQSTVFDVSSLGSSQEFRAPDEIVLPSREEDERRADFLLPEQKSYDPVELSLIGNRGMEEAKLDLLRPEYDFSNEVEVGPQSYDFSTDLPDTKIDYDSSVEFQPSPLKEVEPPEQNYQSELGSFPVEIGLDRIEGSAPIEFVQQQPVAPFVSEAQTMELDKQQVLDIPLSQLVYGDYGLPQPSELERYDYPMENREPLKSYEYELSDREINTGGLEMPEIFRPEFDFANQASVMEMRYPEVEPINVNFAPDYTVNQGGGQRIESRDWLPTHYGYKDSILNRLHSGHSIADAYGGATVKTGRSHPPHKIEMPTSRIRTSVEAGSIMETVPELIQTMFEFYGQMELFKNGS